MNNISKIILMSSLLASSAAFAIDGTITFDGEIVNTTCTPVVKGGSTTASGKDATVVLPTVAATSFKGVGDTAGKTQFTIELTGGANGTGCTTGTNNSLIAHPYFEPDFSKVDENGYLINTLDADKNVSIQILNNEQNFINLRADSNSQVLSSAISGEIRSYPYYAQYIANKASVPAGEVKGSINYSIIYK